MYKGDGSVQESKSQTRASNIWTNNVPASVSTIKSGSPLPKYLKNVWPSPFDTVSVEPKIRNLVHGTESSVHYKHSREFAASSGLVIIFMADCRRHTLVQRY